MAKGCMRSPFEEGEKTRDRITPVFSFASGCHPSDSCGQKGSPETKATHVRCDNNWYTCQRVGAPPSLPPFLHVGLGCRCSNDSLACSLYVFSSSYLFILSPFHVQMKFPFPVSFSASSSLSVNSCQDTPCPSSPIPSRMTTEMVVKTTHRVSRCRYK